MPVEPPGNRVALTLAVTDTDQVRDLVSGAVPVAGVELTCLRFEPEEIFFRFVRHREWEVSELSLAKYVTLRARGEEWLTAIPVFPSRAFRHSAIYIRPDGPRDDPGALRGARIGIPEWSVTATVWARAVLAHEYGVGLRDVTWVQGGTNQPGRVEGLELTLPDGVRIEPERERSLTELLLAGEIEAIIAPHAPAAQADGSGRVVPLFSDPEAVEKASYAATGIHPIMHVIVVRSDVLDEHRWIAANLLSAFTEAKRRSLWRATDANVSRVPVPWASTHAAHARELFGEDLWPYGLAANRAVLQAFLDDAHEQGLTARHMAPEELFAPETLEDFRV